MAEPANDTRFSDQLCEVFSNAVLEWTRKHHPERLLPDEEYAEWLKQHAPVAAKDP
jgi:hypothetical protein